MLRRLVALSAGAAIVLFAVTAMATQARIDSMGGGARSITVEDETNIFDFPSLLVRYGNLAYIDNINSGGLSSSTLGANTRFGFHYLLGESTVVGIYGGRIGSDTRPSNATSSFFGAGNTFTGSSGLGVGAQASQAGNAAGGPSGETQNGGASADAINAVDLKMGLLFATTFGATTRFGVMLNILGDDGDNEQPGSDDALYQTDQGALLIDFAAGLGLDLVGAELEFALGIEYGSMTDYRDSPNQAGPGFINLAEHWTVNSHYGVRLLARSVIDLFETHKLVPYGEILYGAQEVTNSYDPAGAVRGGSWSAFDIKVGADLRLDLFDNVIVAPGIGLLYAQQTLEGGSFTDRDADRFVSLPFYGFGVDVKVFEWLDFRFGANQSVDFQRWATSSAAGTTEYRQSSVATWMSTGLGFNLPIATDARPSDPSMLKIDINVNPTHWLAGPYFWTGNPSGGWGVSGAISYDW